MSPLDQPILGIIYSESLESLNKSVMSEESFWHIFIPGYSLDLGKAFDFVKRNLDKNQKYKDPHKLIMPFRI